MIDEIEQKKVILNVDTFLKILAVQLARSNLPFEIPTFWWSSALQTGKQTVYGVINHGKSQVEYRCQIAENGLGWLNFESVFQVLMFIRVDMVIFFKATNPMIFLRTVLG